MVVHELKTLAEFYDDVKSGAKTFEARKDDRGFQIGDRLLLRRWNPPHEGYDGQKLLMDITYILRGPGFGIEAGHVVMGIKPWKE